MIRAPDGGWERFPQMSEVKAQVDTERPCGLEVRKSEGTCRRAEQGCLVVEGVSHPDPDVRAVTRNINVFELRARVRHPCGGDVGMGIELTGRHVRREEELRVIIRVG